VARWPHSLFRWKLRRRRSGSLVPIPGVGSSELGNSRDLLVYLPPGYQRSGRRYPVIYMQDGQNLFRPETSFAGDWGLLAGLDSLSPRSEEAIVVGISNVGEDRIDEYSPFVDAKAGGGAGDRYLEFLIGTVKPLVDQGFRTIPGREGSAIAGSSMGGLIGLYGFFRFPQAFGSVAALSPSLWFADRAIFDFVQAAPYTPGRIYLDTGTEEGSSSLVNARLMRDLLLSKGYREHVDFRWVEDIGGGHTEAAWGRRFKAALPFLLTARGTSAS
jgi:predicted alpha/beta superfamily hydrolase